MFMAQIQFSSGTWPDSLPKGMAFRQTHDAEMWMNTTQLLNDYQNLTD